MINLWRINRLLPNYRRRGALVIVLSFLLAALGPATLYIYKYMVDIVTRLSRGGIDESHATRAPIEALILLGVARFSYVALIAAQNRLSYFLFINSLSSLRERILDKVTQLTIDYFEKTRVGEIMDRYIAGVSAVSWWVSTIMNADIIAVVKDGVVVETGTHAALITRTGGLYAKLHGLQNAGVVS